ncbi:MAG TPA: YoaK family protein [Candidatus Acidoferrales bacterium]|nr:YoaK family protein [Candidatus Acidoferrales bacterium]
MPPLRGLGRDPMLLILTYAAGNVDAVSYLGLGQVFTAMMTGNTVLLGLALAQGEIVAAMRSILALSGFAAGVVAGAVIVERDTEKAEWPASVTGAFAAEALVLAVFALLWLVAGKESLLHLHILLLSVAMGIQAAAVRRLGVPGIATTYITGTITTLFVDLVGWIQAVAGRLRANLLGSPAALAAGPWEQRVGLLFGVFGFYCLGAMVGGVLQTRWPALAAISPLLAVVAVVLGARRRYAPGRAH